MEPTDDLMRHLRPVRLMAGGDMHGCEHFTDGALCHVEFVAVEAFGWRLTSKAGIRIGGMAVHVDLVRIIVLVLVLEPEEIDPGLDVAAVEDREIIHDQALLAHRRHDPIEQGRNRSGPSLAWKQQRAL